MGRNKSSKDGYNIYCKECVRQINQTQRDANVERNRRYQAAYLERHRDRINARKLARYHLNSEEICAKNAKYRQENYEHRMNIERASRERNKDKWRPSKNARQSARNRVINEGKFVILDKELRRVYEAPCYNCGSMENQTLDHIVPLSRGGMHSVGNIGTLCLSCNCSKHARTITEWKHSKELLGVG